MCVCVLCVVYPYIHKKMMREQKKMMKKKERKKERVGFPSVVRDLSYHHTFHNLLYIHEEAAAAHSLTGRLRQSSCHVRTSSSTALSRKQQQHTLSQDDDNHHVMFVHHPQQLNNGVNALFWPESKIFHFCQHKELVTR